MLPQRPHEEKAKVFVRFRDSGPDIIDPNKEQKARQRKKPVPEFSVNHTDKYVEITESFKDEKGIRTGPVGSKKKFVVDKVFSTDATEETIFQEVARNLVNGVLEGLNATVLLYGDSNGGRSLTLFGAEGAQAGLLPRSAKMIFDAIAEATQSKFTVTFSVMDIVREELIDLLTVKSDKLTIQEADGTAIVIGLKTEDVFSLQDIEELIAISSRIRRKKIKGAQQPTPHSVFDICVTSETRRDESVIVKQAHLKFFSVAGAEELEGVTNSKEAREAAHGLASLKACLQAICNSSNPHGPETKIPFKNSKLTFALRSFLGGNCLSALCITCPSSNTLAPQTSSILELGQIVMTLKNTVSVNVFGAAKDEQPHVTIVQKQAETMNQELKELRNLLVERALEADSITTELNVALRNEKLKVIDLEEQLEAKNLEVEAMSGIAAHAMERILELEKKLGYDNSQLTVSEHVAEKGESKYQFQGGAVATARAASIQKLDERIKIQSSKIVQLEKKVKDLTDELQKKDTLFDDVQIQFLQLKRDQRLKLAAKAEVVPVKDGPAVLSNHDKLKEARKGTPLEFFGSQYPIPTGALASAGKSGSLLQKEYGRDTMMPYYFIVRDSLLLKYENQKDYLSPESQVHPIEILNLIDSKVHSKGVPWCEFSFVILLGTGDRYVLASSSDAEKQSWVRALKMARFNHHSSFVEHSVSIKLMIQAVSDSSARETFATEMRFEALSLFQNFEYVAQADLLTFSDGWLNFCSKKDALKQATKFVGPNWKPVFVVLLGSHMALYSAHHKSLSSEPKVVVHLACCSVTKTRIGKKKWGMSVESQENSFSGVFLCDTEAAVDKWIFSLKIAARLTQSNLMLLAQARETLMLRLGGQDLQVPVQDMKSFLHEVIETLNRYSKEARELAMLTSAVSSVKPTKLKRIPDAKSKEDDDDDEIVDPLAGLKDISNNQSEAGPSRPAFQFVPISTSFRFPTFGRANRKSHRGTSISAAATTSSPQTPTSSVMKQPPSPTAGHSFSPTMIEQPQSSMPEIPAAFDFAPISSETKEIPHQASVPAAFTPQAIEIEMAKFASDSDDDSLLPPTEAPPNVANVFRASGTGRVAIESEDDD